MVEISKIIAEREPDYNMLPYLSHSIGFSDEGITITRHGVKGMRWGVRKSRTKSTSNSNKESSSSVNKNKKLGSTKSSRSNIKKNRRSLNDENLNNFIDRLKKEKELSNLIDNDVSPGKKFLKEMTTNAAKSAGSQILSKAMVYGTSAALKKTFSAAELGQAIYSSGGEKKKSK